MLISGIYFLKQNEKVVYVGQSINVHRRVEDHMKDKDFNNWEYIECDKELLDCTEEAYILRFNPIYNKRKAEIKVTCNSLKIAKEVKKIVKEKNKGWKHLRVEESTHKRVKGLAVFKGLGIDETIAYLLDREKIEKQNTSILNYRKKEIR